MTPGYYLAQHNNGSFAWIHIYQDADVLRGQWGSPWVPALDRNLSYDHTYLSYVQDIDRIKLYFRATHASTFIDSEDLYIYILHTSSYKYIRYNLRTTISRDCGSTPYVATLTSTDYQNNFYRHVYPEHTL